MKLASPFRSRVVLLDYLTSVSPIEQFVCGQRKAVKVISHHIFPLVLSFLIDGIICFSNSPNVTFVYPIWSDFCSNAVFLVLNATRNMLSPSLLSRSLFLGE